MNNALGVRSDLIIILFIETVYMNEYIMLKKSKQTLLQTNAYVSDTQNYLVVAAIKYCWMKLVHGCVATYIACK